MGFNTVAVLYNDFNFAKTPDIGKRIDNAMRGWHERNRDRLATHFGAGIVVSQAHADYSQVHHVREDLRECRKDLGFAWVWAMFPFTLPLSFAFTGGWQDGFRWDCDGAR